MLVVTCFIGLGDERSSSFVLEKCACVNVCQIKMFSEYQKNSYINIKEKKNDKTHLKLPLSHPIHTLSHDTTAPSSITPHQPLSQPDQCIHFFPLTLSLSPLLPTLFSLYFQANIFSLTLFIFFLVLSNSPALQRLLHPWIFNRPLHFFAFLHSSSSCFSSSTSSSSASHRSSPTISCASPFPPHRPVLTLAVCHYR